MKKNNNYFELIKQQYNCCLRASAFLNDVIHDCDFGKTDEYIKTMHKTEQEADEIQHDILNRLSTEFITPIDGEDILHLVQIIDDITDALDETVQDIYMYRIDRLSKETALLSSTVNECVEALSEAIVLLKNFKKPNELRNKLVKVNDVESKADEIYIGAIHKLFGTEESVKKLMGAAAVYKSLENCCDLCEHAADVIEQIIIKNT